MNGAPWRRAARGRRKRRGETGKSWTGTCWMALRTDEASRFVCGGRYSVLMNTFCVNAKSRVETGGMSDEGFRCRRGGWGAGRTSKVGRGACGDSTLKSDGASQPQSNDAPARCMWRGYQSPQPIWSIRRLGYFAELFAANSPSSQGACNDAAAIATSFSGLSASSASGTSASSRASDCGFLQT